MASDMFDADDIVCTALTEVGLGTLQEVFKNEQIDADSVTSLTDRELEMLGVHTMGKRHRFRTAVSELLSSKQKDSAQSDALRLTVADERARLFTSRVDRKRKNTQNNVKMSGSSGSKTWIMQFMCLAFKDQTHIPTCVEKEILNKAGLGVKRISVDRNATESDLFKRIMCEERDPNTNMSIGFPQLKEIGGFELLRTTPNCRKLKHLDCVWTAKEIRRSMNPQANIYIRPIQTNLSTKPIQQEEESQNCFKTTCRFCQTEMPVRELRQHSMTCQGTHAPSLEANNEATEQSQTVDLHQESDTQILTESFSAPVSEQNVVDTLPISAGNTVIYVLNGTVDEDVGLNPTNETVPNISPQPENVIDIVKRTTIQYCTENNITDPVEILRKLQLDVCTGRPLDIEDISQGLEGETSFIMVDRDEVLMTGFDEINAITDLRKTLEVQFYAEAAQDYGGPRKEFLQMILSRIKEKYFDNGLRDLLAADYETVGKVLALSVLQNGKIPRFMGPEVLSEVFQNTSTTSACVLNLRAGLDALGIYEVCRQLPSFAYLFSPTSVTLTYRRMVCLLTPTFSEEGSNRNALEKMAYTAFLKYLREVASGRRGPVSLPDVLQFVTGADEEPALGFQLHPSIQFREVETGTYLPTANTCSNCLHLPRPPILQNLPADNILFELFDYAFANKFYGLK